MLVSKPLRLLLPVLVVLSAGDALAADVSPSMLKIEQFNAERGDAQSQYFIGEHYEMGDSGVERNLSIALEWYRKAAQQGHAAAQYKIGLFHDNGFAGLTGGREAAMEWYKKASANGSDGADRKLAEIRKAEEEAEAAVRQQQEEMKERERQQARRKQQREQKRATMLRANKPAMAALPMKLPAKKRPVQYPPEQVMERLLSTTWSSAGKHAEYLPSDDMNCLKTGEREITCFSHARERVLGKMQLNFTVKSVLSDFKQDGTFTSRYFYHVTEMDKAGYPGPASDSFGLKAKRGWQQPGHTAKCRLRKPDNIVCSGYNQATVKFNTD